MEDCYKSLVRWLPKLLNGGTGQQWRSATEASVPPGFKFTPTDQILIVYYLIPYVLTGCIPWNHVVVERVYEKEPCELLDDDHDVRYFFAKRTKCGHAGDRIRRTEGGKKGWTGKTRKSEIVSADGKTIGFKYMLSYCVDGKSEGYTMYEYELPQSVTNNFMQEEGAPTLHEWVLCCVKKSPQKIAGSKRSWPEAAAETKAAIVSSKQAPHDGAFEVSGEYPVCNTSTAVVAAASYNTEPLTESKTASSTMHLPTAAEASLEGRVHTEASDFASADQIMSSSAVDQLPSACCGSYWTENENRAVVPDTFKQYELKMTAAEVATTALTTALPPSSGLDGAINTGNLGWVSKPRCPPPPQPIDMEMSPPMNLPPNSALDLPPESAPVDVATSTAADCSVTSPIVAEASLEGGVHTETIELASTDQIMSSSAIDQQPPAYNDSYRTEEMINADISDTCEMTTAEQHLPPPSCQDGDQPTASAIHTGQNLRYSPLLPQFDGQMPQPPDILPRFYWETGPPPDL